MTPFRVVIPARLASTRLPGKALALIAGEPLVVHVWRRAVDSGAAEVLVAVDDERIAAAVEAVGGRAVMTARTHRSGTDRLAEVARREGWGDEEIVVNLQGDEPQVPPSLLAELAAGLADRTRAGIATVATPISDPAELWSPSVVKVVTDREGYALYFSRAPIPWDRERFGAGMPEALSPPSTFLRHLGVYAYRVGTLSSLAGAPPSELERVESLEQLRASSMGIPIWVSRISSAPPPGVDTPEDLERVRRALSRS